MGLRSLGLAGLGAGLCKRNSVLNILCPSSLIIYSTSGDAEIARPDITRPGNAAPDQTEVKEHG